ncbi:hypothetical protein NP233_g1688 [Leucocoprinus birnbaumii]|uniref:WD40 repeat-like protein n=1 Tax=Leucocoprinus birnbaumii TaxID=56174 RepID=A0AAD5W240_9AGAR|nr:hypothetical protein NP233_g1688 [Leucocoprinus birnbaumii]
MPSSDTSNFLVSEAHLVLDEARKNKAERTKYIGEPINLQGKALDLIVHEGFAWIAENTTVARKLDLETGKILQTFKGHTAPVTTLAFCDKNPGTGDQKILITGSWDKTIKLWDTEVTDPLISENVGQAGSDIHDQNRNLISSTDAHEDFVKALYVFPTLRLLISGSSDKIVRFWDLSNPLEGKPLRSLGSISSHTRPIECLQGKIRPDGLAVLYTADTMGMIKVWELSRNSDPDSRWSAALRQELNYHRTRINDMCYGSGQLWTASTDETVQVNLDPDVQTESKVKPPLPIVHPKQVRCILPIGLTDIGEPYLITGSDDMIRVYDLSTFDEPEMIREVDAHWHDVLTLRLWIRKSIGDDGIARIEPWIVSSSLDGTIRKWRLIELITPPPKAEPVKKAPVPPPEPQGFQMTEEEEQELADLMDED